MYDKYINQDINNPKYLFHGSPKKLYKLEPKTSQDSKNINNVDTAIFLTPSLVVASAYAFKDTIKENSMDLDCNFSIKFIDEYPVMTMKNVNIDEGITGYIYVFENNNKIIKDADSNQYRCYYELTPIDIIRVSYKDFKDYYEVINRKMR